MELAPCPAARHPPLQLSETEGTLTATRRQLAAAQQEQDRLHQQLQAGMAAAPGAAAGVPSAVEATVLQELTKKTEEEQDAQTGQLAYVSAAAALCHSGWLLLCSKPAANLCPTGLAAAPDHVPAQPPSTHRLLCLFCDLPYCREMQCKSFEKMARQFKNTANTNNACLTCNRQFASDAERQAFLAKQASWGGRGW